MKKFKSVRGRYSRESERDRKVIRCFFRISKESSSQEN